MKTKDKKDRKYVNMFDLFPEENKVPLGENGENTNNLSEVPLCYNGVNEIDLMAV